MLNTELLITEKEIKAFLEEISSSDEISIDIEFMRRNTFFPEPCVIQLSNGDFHGCIDLTLSIDYKNLFRNIFDSDKKIILHSCRQDLEILNMILGYIPKNIFDTQFAASFLGFKYQIGYAELIKEIYNITIDKTEKMTNWKKRPLSQKQINYAINDVLHLNKLSKYLNEKLIETRKINFYNEEFTNYVSDIEWNPSTESSWKKLKSINNLSNQTQDIARIVAIWREKKAINKNIPRNWIMSEKEIIEVSKAYVSKNEILIPEKKDSNKNNKYVKEIQEEIKNFSGRKINLYKNKKRKYNSNYKKIADDLYEYYKQVSLYNEISYQIVSPKKMILNFLRNNDCNSRLITGWRKEIIDINKITEITNPYFNSN